MCCRCRCPVQQILFSRCKIVCRTFLYIKWKLRWKKKRLNHESCCSYNICPIYHNMIFFFTISSALQWHQLYCHILSELTISDGTFLTRDLEDNQPGNEQCCDKGNHRAALCHIQMGETGNAGALPLRINKHCSLELQIEKKVERQWPARYVNFPVYRVGI